MKPFLITFAFLLSSLIGGCLPMCNPILPAPDVPSATPSSTATASPSPLTLTATATQTNVPPTETATSTTATPSPSATDSPTPTATPTLGLLTPPGRNTLPSTGAPSLSIAWLVILGVVLVTLGAWVFDWAEQGARKPK